MKKYSNMTKEIPKVCPYCGGKVSLRDSKIIYKTRSYGLIYLCDNYPVCSAFVGVHKGTTNPLGTLADTDLRELRKKCHAKFDDLWLNGSMARWAAYAWLQKELNMTQEQAHIGMFRTKDCLKLLKILS
jgi:DNA-directed RNA polymerase subunit RPC12/RpoP